MTREDLEPIAEIVKEKDLYVISDEIYAELTYGQDHCSIASLPGMRDRTDNKPVRSNRSNDKRGGRRSDYAKCI